MDKSVRLYRAWCKGTIVCAWLFDFEQQQQQQNRTDLILIRELCAQIALVRGIGIQLACDNVDIAFI